MAKQLTAPGCKYSIVARVDTTIYSPDQKWTLDVPAGQTDFIAETNEIIIPADAMMCQKKCQIDADLARVNVLGKGSGSLATFVTRAIEQIVGKGKVSVAYGAGKLTVSLALDTTDAQIAEVESLLDRLLPNDVSADLEWVDGLPMSYTRLEYIATRSPYTMWISLPSHTNQDSVIEVKVAKTGAGNLWYAITSFKDNNYQSNTRSVHSITGHDGWLYGQYNKQTSPYNAIQMVQQNVPFVLKFDKNKLSNTNRTYVFEAAEFTSEGTIRLFVDGNYINQVTASAIYWAKIQAVEATYNLVPAFSPTEGPGLYDTVGKNFYTKKNPTSADFVYPGQEAAATTYSLRKPATYVKLTQYGTRTLYDVPANYKGTKEEYATEHGFKELIEQPMPEEGYWTPTWKETDTQVLVEWVETEPPTEEEQPTTTEQ